MSFDDYEALPETVSPLVHMAAGAAAGMFEHLAMFPFDVVKTRMQRLRPNPDASYRNLVHGLTTMVRTEGAGSLFKGVQAVAIGAGPAHALYFATYEQSKKVLGGGGTHTIATAGAGVCATFAHDMFMNPIEVVKQRLQVHSSPYTSMVHCAGHVLRHEGILAFYRSFTTQLMMNIPFQATHVVVYETTRTMLNPSGEYNPKIHFIAGGLGGGVAAAVSTPFDVAKTLLNTQEICPGAAAAHTATMNTGKYVEGMVNAMRTIYHVGGVNAYFKGLSARVLYTAPAAAISWSVYEFFKHIL